MISCYNLHISLHIWSIWPFSSQSASKVLGIILTIFNLVFVIEFDLNVYLPLQFLCNVNNKYKFSNVSCYLCICANRTLLAKAKCNGNLFGRYRAIKWKWSFNEGVGKCRFGIVNDNKKGGVFLVKIGFCCVFHNKLLLITAKLPIINRFMSKQMNVVRFTITEMGLENSFSELKEQRTKK